MNVFVEQLNLLIYVGLLILESQEPFLSKMLPSEIRATLMVGMIFVFRMLGIFMIFPVLALYLNHYQDASMTMVGFALGAYGLFQAMLQLPLAALSDKFGRKRIILAGLALFALGSVVAAFATTLWAIALGRAIQGAGAIGATSLAYIADQTRPIVRTRAMAMVGILIGLSFTLSVAIGPMVDAWFGLKGLFLLTGLLAAVGILWVSFIPNNQPTNQTTALLSFSWRSLYQALIYAQLWRLYLSVFTLHAVLTMCFLMIPLKVHTLLGLDKLHSWQFYVPMLLASLVCVLPFLRRADEEGRQKVGLIIAIVALLGVVPVWLLAEHNVVFIIMSVLFFCGFNYLEASLPARVSQQAPDTRRGLVLGIYSSAQFLGLFAGGSVGGWVWSHWHQWGLSAVCAGLLLAWFLWMVPRTAVSINPTRQSI